LFRLWWERSLAPTRVWMSSGGVGVTWEWEMEEVVMRKRMMS
jgi:hypothetical protein